MNYSNKIKEIKKTLKLTTEQMSFDLGMPARTLGSYERGESKPPLELLTKLYEQYSINPIWFVQGKGTMFLSTCGNTLEKRDNKDLTKNTDTFYQRFNRIQKENNLNDYQLSKMTGISEARIEKLGIGKVLPTFEELNALKTHFDISIDWLLYGSTQSQNTQDNNDSLSLDEIAVLKKLAKKYNF